MSGSLSVCPSCFEVIQDDYCANCRDIGPAQRLAAASAVAPIWRYVTCTGDIERPTCEATVREERRVNGRWPVVSFCPACEAAFHAREARQAQREAA